jgi:transaldolase/glucose-6-phosphate isomerase
MSQESTQQEAGAVSEEERGQGFRLGRYEDAVRRRLERWQAEGFGRRLWDKDPSLWAPKPLPELVDRLGWLTLPAALAGDAGGIGGSGEIEAFSRLGDEIRQEGFRDAVVLGMGGSSLAPEVFALTFGHAPGYPTLSVLDSTHPAAVRALAGRLDLARTLFVVSSKSGGTTETMSFFRACWDLVGRVLDRDPGSNFVAVTDAGSSLEKLARERGFRAVFNAPEDVGGRYSAFTSFGLVPAALIGANLRALAESGRTLAEASGPDVPAADNPGLYLGAALGELALAGRDKVTFLTTRALESFPDWIEQLVAESTGKRKVSGDGHAGIVPVVGERPGAPESYGEDRFFVALLLGRDGEEEVLDHVDALQRAGHPVACFRLDSATDLGREIFRWELAVAAAGSVIGVQPFDQPDVQLAKELATQAMKKAAGDVEGASARAEREVEVDGGEVLRTALRDWLHGTHPGDYLGIHAYLAPSAETTAALRELQQVLRDGTRLATTLGYGPRFLHSTGQLHKGGTDQGRFLQIVDTPQEDVPVPETQYTFGTLIRAQAEGDRQALEQRGRKVLRVQLGTGGQTALAALLDAAREVAGG